MRNTAARSLFALLFTAIAGVIFVSADARATTTISQGYITESDIAVIKVAPLVDESIKKVFNEESVSGMFR